MPGNEIARILDADTSFDTALEQITEQMHGLDAFKTLVHEGGGIDGDLRTHVPRWMGQGLSLIHI